MAHHPHPVMMLVAERKLGEFISPPTPDGVLEASGVIAKGADYYVIFDNVRRIARIHRSLEAGSTRHSWFGPKREGEGYEDIAFSRYTRRFYLLIEAEKHPDGTYKALIDECDESARYKRRRGGALSVEKANTRFEGVGAIPWGGEDYLLALWGGDPGCAFRTQKRPTPAALTPRPLKRRAATGATTRSGKKGGGGAILRARSPTRFWGGGAPCGGGRSFSCPPSAKEPGVAFPDPKAPPPPPFEPCGLVALVDE